MSLSARTGTIIRGIDAEGYRYRRWHGSFRFTGGTSKSECLTEVANRVPPVMSGMVRVARLMEISQDGCDWIITVLDREVQQ